MAAAYSGNSLGHEVPYCYATIVAADGQLCAPPVEGAGESFTARVQDTFIVLQRVCCLAIPPGAES